jgi:radical SAM superfamily enzyme YgiQ (UPF0313 family)
MNIKLVAPDRPWEASVSSGTLHAVQKANLPLLAALTPSGHDVTIVDESFAPDKPDGDVDLVGITVMTDMALRAYKIADDYRARGVKVVMGGIHPTVFPEEALKHSDAVVVGEGETTWPHAVQDAAAGRLRAIYRAPGMTDLSTLPIPKHELYPRPRGRSFTPTGIGVETSRGCPHDCEFCSITHVLGKKYRMRPARDIIRDLDSLPSRNIFFVDDSLGLNRSAAKKLFAEMTALRKFWVGQATLSLAEDVDLLRLMRKSGCHGLLVGFESIDEKSQETMGKIHALKIGISEAVHRFHEEGIALSGAFIFGFDNQDITIFDRTIEFVSKNKIDAIPMGVLCPFPGTRLYQRLLAEGRLFDPKWWLRGYPPFTLLYRLQKMTPEEFFEGLDRLVKELHSVKNMVSRFFGIKPWRRPIRGYALYAGVNLAQRKRYLNDLKIPQPFPSA